MSSFSKSTFSFSYSPADRTDIGRYACQHGTAAAACFFSRKLRRVSENTVVSMKKEYKQEKQKSEINDDVSVLPHKKRGRPLLLGDLMDDQVQAYVKK